MHDFRDIGTAMHLLRHTDALILDSRENAGGSPDMMALLASYCFDETGLPLADIISRTGDVKLSRKPESWTVTASAYVRTDFPTHMVRRRRNRYILQERHRAEIIGETTVGPANVTKPYKIDDTFYANIPNSHLRTAIRGSNWEGIEVIPDVAVPAASALRVAQEHALTPDGLWHRELERELQKVQVQQVAGGKSCTIDEGAGPIVLRARISRQT